MQREGKAFVKADCIAILLALKNEDPRQYMFHYQSFTVVELRTAIRLLLYAQPIHSLKNKQEAERQDEQENEQCQQIAQKQKLLLQHYNRSSSNFNQ